MSREVESMSLGVIWFRGWSFDAEIVWGVITTYISPLEEFCSVYLTTDLLDLLKFS